MLVNHWCYYSNIILCSCRFTLYLCLLSATLQSPLQDHIFMDGNNNNIYYTLIPEMKSKEISKNKIRNCRNNGIYYASRHSYYTQGCIANTQEVCTRYVSEYIIILCRYIALFIILCLARGTKNENKLKGTLNDGQVLVGKWVR